MQPAGRLKGSSCRLTDGGGRGEPHVPEWKRVGEPSGSMAGKHVFPETCTSNAFLRMPDCEAAPCTGGARITGLHSCYLRLCRAEEPECLS